MEKLTEFVSRYDYLFKSRTHTYVGKPLLYIQGLFQGEKGNIEKMCEKVDKSDVQQMHHFISNSPWDAEVVMNKVASDINEVFRYGQERVGLLLDESGIKKQGKKSVGVARQYIGNLGKVENGQVGVFASLVQGDKVAIIDTRLYLPKEWTEDKMRCLKAGIPIERIVFKTKPKLALEMAFSARERGIRVDWIGGDGAYGHDSDFRRELDDKNEFYVLDCHCDQRVYTSDPKPHIPARTSSRGPAPSRYKTAIRPLEAKSFIDEPDSEWKEYCYRQGSKGDRRRKVFCKTIWTWDGLAPKARQEKLIISKNPDGSNVKYSLCNDRTDKYSAYDLLYMQMQRYWIERAFQDAKSELGMAEYQVRTWMAWHHHMALTMLALLFMLNMKIENEDDIPLLSCSDIKLILANTLPQKVKNKQDIASILIDRHKRRKRDIDRFT